MTTGYTGSSGTSTLTRQDSIDITDQGGTPVLVMGNQHYMLPTQTNDLKWFRDQFSNVVDKLDQKIGSSSNR